MKWDDTTRGLLMGFLLSGVDLILWVAGGDNEAAKVLIGAFLNSGVILFFRIFQKGQEAGS